MAEKVGTMSLRPAAPCRMLAAMRKIVVLAFPGVQSLDVAGPVEVFAGRRRLRRRGRRAPAAGTVPAHSGLTLHVDRSLADVAGPLDTLVIAGGEGTPAVVADADVVGRVRRARHPSAVGWRRCAAARSCWPRPACSTVAGSPPTGDRGPAGARATPRSRSTPTRSSSATATVWTSAGVTAGIDLALALVEDDLGRDVALAVARRLVVLLKRPGGQSQFSAQLAGPVRRARAARELQGWIADHLDDDLRVERLAGRGGHEPPQLLAGVHRRGRGDAGPLRRATPASRLPGACSRSRPMPVDEMARRCGFGTAETLRRAFLRACCTSTPERLPQPVPNDKESA